MTIFAYIKYENYFPTEKNKKVQGTRFEHQNTSKNSNCV